MKKSVSILTTLVAVASLCLVPVSGALAADQQITIDDMGGFTGYYQTHNVSVDDLISTWGTPSQVVKCENGAERYTFPIRAIQKDTISFIVKDGKVVGCR